MRRLTAALLALCMALSLLGTAAALEEDPAPPAEEMQVLPMQPEDLQKKAEPSSENTMGDPIAAAEGEDAPDAEPAPVEAPVEEDIPSAAESVPEFTVTTGEAENISAFSATLSMTIEGNRFPYMKNMKVFGFEYWIGERTGTPDTFGPHAGTWEAPQGLGGIVKYPDSNTMIYTGPVGCLPGTAYTYRAFFIIEDENDYGYHWEFYAENVGTFTTPADSGSRDELTPGSSLSFDLAGGESAYFTLNGNEPGFYRLSTSAESTEGSSFSSNASVEKGGGWDEWYEDNPLYLDGRRYGKVTLNNDEEKSATCTVTLSSFQMEELTASGTTKPFSGTAYFQFTPEAGKRYQLTFHGDEGGLGQWSTEEMDWTYESSFSDGSSWLLSPKDGGTCYFRVSSNYNAPCTVTVSEFTSAAEPTVWCGTPQQRDLFHVSIPVMAQVPPADSQKNLRAGIQYQVDGVTGEASAGGNCVGELLSLDCSLDPFPGKTYRYRAFLEIRGSNGNVEKTVWEADWHTYTADPATPIVLSLEKNTISFEGDWWKLLSFTPTEDGRYTFTMENLGNPAFWNSEDARWTWRNSGETLELKKGVPLYIKVQQSGDGSGSVTVEKFTATVTGFSIAAERPEDIENFHARIPLSAQVPIGSSFWAGVTLNGIDVDSYRLVNHPAESWTSRAYVDVLPNTQYTCIPYIQQFDAETNQPIGNRVTGDEITFQTGDFPVTPLPVGKTTTQDTDHNTKQFFSFTPQEAGFYELSVTGSAPGFLYWWNAETGGWDSGTGANFSGSVKVLLSAEADVPQYLWLYPATGETASYQVAITRYTSTVTEPAVKTVKAETGIPGFTALFTAEVEVPLGQYYRVEVQTKQSDGVWRTVNGGGIISGAQGDTQTVTCTMNTLPKQAYTCRVHLLPTDSNGYELSGTAHAYSNEVRFTSEAATAATVLSDGSTAEGTYQENQDAYFIFTPQETGPYRITVTGADRLFVSTPDNSGWQSYWDLAQPVAIRLEKGTPRYLRLPGSWKGSYTIQVSKVVSGVTGFTVTSGTATAAAGDLEFTVPVTVTAPIASEYSYSVDYWPQGSDMWLSADADTEPTTEEACTYQLKLPAYPGITYTYRAYVYDQNSRERYEETEEHTFTMPALTVQPEAMEENQPTAPQAAGARWAFTPAKDGYYLFTVEGSYGTLTVLRADGTWERLYYYEDPYSGASEKAINVRLPGNQTAYVVLENQNAGVPASVEVGRTPLAASWEYDAGSRQIKVSLEAEAAGTYLFAAYSAPGKLLAVKVLENAAAGNVAAILSAGNEARYVKAFRLNGDNQPQAAAVYTPIGR